MFKTQHAIGFLETQLVARGIVALDGALKVGEVELLAAQVIARGKYIWMINGVLADVQEAMKRARELAAGTVLDEFVIETVHEQVLPAFKARQKVEPADFQAVGVIETKETASAIFAADAAAKEAEVKLLECKQQPGGKGLLVLTGEIGAVRRAIEAGRRAVRKPEHLLCDIVIPAAHQKLRPFLT